MKRRDLLKLPASIAAAAAAGNAQQHDHPSGGTPPAAAAWHPEFFDDHEAKTVIALIDLIIPATDTPGASAAHVDRHLDHLLAAMSEEEKTKFREGLWWVDGYAIRKHGGPFASCTPDQQRSMLEALDDGNDPNLAPGHQFFQLIKGATAEIYYATETGFNELNKGGRVPATFGCPHPEHS